LLLRDNDIELAARVPAVDVGREFALLAANEAGIGRADARVELTLGVGRAAGVVGMALVSTVAIGRIGEPNRAAGFGTMSFGELSGLPS
jgi:hypothetical protein